MKGDDAQKPESEEEKDRCDPTVHGRQIEEPKEDVISASLILERPNHDLGFLFIDDNEGNFPIYDVDGGDGENSLARDPCKYPSVLLTPRRNMLQSTSCSFHEICKAIPGVATYNPNPDLAPAPGRRSFYRIGKSTICYRPPSYSDTHLAMLVSSPPILKSCLVKCDHHGRRVSCSCVDTKQLTFHPPTNSVGIRILAGEPRSDNETDIINILPPESLLPEVFSSKYIQNAHFEMDEQSQYSLYMEKDCRFYFQHPIARLFVAYFVIFCNFLLFAEDPVSHSHTECQIPIVGNVFSFVMTKYPPELGWKFLKIILWAIAIIVGMVIGKCFFHKIVFGRLLRLKMFHEEQGSWTIIFLTVILTLYVFSNVYNLVLFMGHQAGCSYHITSLMGITNSSLMKVAACGTWLGDFITAWMVTDMMFQDSLYPHWAPTLRAFWRNGNTRIVTFWLGAVGMTSLVIALIVSDLISWDKLNRDFMPTTEISRAFLASFILVMDLLIVMQDWDFPHFTSTLDINLPGMKTSAVSLQFWTCPQNLQHHWRIHISGKWFNYGIIFLVMILDINMWNNQIFYTPEAYGQYTGHDKRIYTVSDQAVLTTGNNTFWTYEWRAFHVDPNTNLSYLEGDMLMNSRYLGYAVEEKCIAFFPSVIGFFMFGALIYLYGRFPPKEGETLGGRLKKRKKHSRSSWRRERVTIKLPKPKWKFSPFGVSTYFLTVGSLNRNANDSESHL